ncbi:hypothetical protein D3C80_1728740 [compost metagenome]
MAGAAIVLLYFNIKVTVGRGSKQILNQKWTRWDMGLINDKTILLDGHAGIALGNTAHRWCIALQAAGVHLFIGGQLDTTKSNTVKYI